MKSPLCQMLKVAAGAGLLLFAGSQPAAVGTMQPAGHAVHGLLYQTCPIAADVAAFPVFLVLFCRRTLLPHIVRLQLLVAVERLVVLHAKLRNGQFITIKVWPAVRAARAVEQLVAERSAGHMFAWHPTMTTVLGISGNTPSGNFTTVTQWAGYSLQDLMDDPAWWQQPLVVRGIVAQRVARCIFMGLATMHAEVGGGWCCFPAAATRVAMSPRHMPYVHDAGAGNVTMCMKPSCDVAVNVTL
jgi:hypothetical protein